jgi:hypothetical protein
LGSSTYRWRNLILAGYANIGSLQIGGTQVIDTSRNLVNIVTETLAGLTTDPPLAAGKLWYRSDLQRIRYSPDGVNVISIDPPISISMKELAEVVNVFGKTSIPSGVFAPIPLPALPGTTQSYGSMVLWKNRFIFILRGNNAYDFWVFDIERGQFKTLKGTQAPIYYGSLVGVHADRYLYTCRGYDGTAGTQLFYRYDIWRDVWESMAYIPVTVDFKGGGACYDGSRYVYLLRGAGYSGFYCYDCVNNTWTTLASTPAGVNYPSNIVKAGNYLYVLAGGGTTTFYRYDIANNTWSSMAPAPDVTSAGALAWDGGDYIYALQGNSANGFWRYKISTNTWETLTPTPAATSYGGLVYYNSPAIGEVIFVREGLGTTTWWIYKI